MCKKTSNLLMLGLLALASCTQGGEEPQGPQAPDTPGNGSTVEIAFSRAADDNFAAAGIESYTIYVYKIERRASSLYFEKEVNVGDDAVTIEFPLGDNFRTFAVANATVSDKESYETVTINVDPASGREVWASAATLFSSDKSSATISLTFQRLIALVDFTPADDAADLAAQTAFDSIELSFTNTARSYNVSTGAIVPETYTVTTGAAEGYKAQFYTLATNTLEDNSALSIVFKKGGNEVNTSAGALDTGVKYRANNRYFMSVPLLNNSFVTTPWTDAQARSEAGAFTVDVTPL